MNHKQSSGFVLATMIVLSSVLILIGVTVLQTVVSISATYKNTYINQVAQQAAEAGVAAAAACIAANNNEQSWGTSAPNLLTPDSTCTGADNGTSSEYVLNTTAMRSKFLVGNLTVRIDGALIINSTGTAERLDSSGNVLESKVVSVGQMKTWKSNFQGSVTSSGWNRTCGVVSKAAYCWGTNQYGQLGNNSTTNSATPVKVTQAPGLLQNKVVDGIVSGMFHNCVLAAGEVYCWGNNYYGQLGDNTTTHRSVPVKVGGVLAGKTVTSIAASSYSTCAIADGEIYCWGRNNSGQLGINSTTTMNVPTKVSGLAGKVATKLSSSGGLGEVTCAIVDNDGYCWGKNTNSQLGLGAGNTAATAVPTPISKLSGRLQGKTVTAISTDAAWSGAQTGNGAPTGNTTDGHGCALASGQVYCWGVNNDGQLGIGSTSSRTGEPTATVATSMTATVTEIAVGAKHSCAIAAGEVWCWGDNNLGQNGNRTRNSAPVTLTRTSPVKVAQDAGVFLGQTVSQLGGGSNRGCAVANLKTYCWGNNDQGQIGDGTSGSGNIRDYPVESIYLRPKAPVFIF